MSLNDCAAHWSPNPGETRVFGENDICKVDFGTHINGYLIDSAFTACFDPRLENLVLALKESTWAGIKASGIDVRLCDVGACVNEVMTS